MKVVWNALESGDWVVIKTDDDETVFEGHSINPRDFVDIINNLGGVGRFKEEAELVEVDDEQIQTGDY